MKGLAALALSIVGAVFALRAAQAGIGAIVLYRYDEGVGPAVFSFSWQLGVALLCLFWAWLLWSAWREDRLMGGGKSFAVVLVAGLVGLGVFVFGDNALDILQAGRANQATVDSEKQAIAEEKCLADYQEFKGLSRESIAIRFGLDSDLPACVEYRRIRNERIRKLE